MKVDTPFIDEVSGLAVVKILDRTTHIAMVIKLKYIWNLATLNITNNGLDTIIFDPKEELGIIDLRSLGYYKIKQDILQQNLSKYYRLKKMDILCEHFNKFVNMLKKKRQQVESKENYPWLDPRDDRNYMTDREILEKYIDPEKSCLMEKERKEVMDMPYKYKRAFGLKDETDTFLIFR